ncbi:MAG: FeS-binding protein [bacterium]|nr:FeS-binding protein [bacterium]
MASAKYFCIFPQELISQPIISHTLGEKFKVVPNIRAASIQPTGARVIVEIEGEPDEIERSVEYLRECGVDVKPIVDGEEPVV